MTVREVIRLLEADGWALRPGRVTISGNLRDEMPKGTFASVKRQAGWKGPKP